MEKWRAVLEEGGGGGGGGGVPGGVYGVGVVEQAHEYFRGGLFEPFNPKWVMVGALQG